MEVEIPTMSGMEFASAYGLRPNLYAWFLGAGASAASGIPTGYAMIRDFKKRIFCQNNGYSVQEVDSGDQLWADRIDDYFRRTSLLPPQGDPEEYSAAFEAVFPQEDHRRQYIDEAVSKGRPCFAHRVLAALISSRQLDCVFTTNFDPLVEDSVVISNELLASQGNVKKATVAAIDSAERAQRCLKESDWPLVAKLHGDYKSSRIKNTSSELQTQDADMREVLLETCKRFGLVIVGYSGRDSSVMEALEHVLREPHAYPGGLYWVTSSKNSVLPAVRKLLEHAVIAGVNAVIVESKTFDELAGDLIAQVKLPEVLRNHVEIHKIAERLVPVVPLNVDARQFPVLRYSAILVESLPAVARRLSLSKSLNIEDARKLLKEHRCRAVVATLGRELAVFGRDEEVVKVFAALDAKVDGTITLNPEKDSWALGLIYDAFARALCRGRPLLPRLKRTGHALVVAGHRADDDFETKQRRDEELALLKSAYGSLTGNVPKVGHYFCEGIQLKLEKVQDKWWCGFEPFTFVDVPFEAKEQGTAGGKEFTRPMMRVPDASADWRRERWAQKYNGNWSQIITAWSSMLTTSNDGSISALGLKNGDGVDAVFKISSVTGWSRPSHHHAYFERSK